MAGGTRPWPPFLHGSPVGHDARSLFLASPLPDTLGVLIVPMQIALIQTLPLLHPEYCICWAVHSPLTVARSCQLRLPVRFGHSVAPDGLVRHDRPQTKEIRPSYCFSSSFFSASRLSRITEYA